MADSKLRDLSSRITLSSDSHGKETLDYGFDDAKALLRDVGFTQTFVLYTENSYRCLCEISAALNLKINSQAKRFINNSVKNHGVVCFCGAFRKI